MGRFCQRVQVALRARLGLDVAFAPPRLRPFEDAWHRLRTLKDILGQAAHHGLTGDPPREGSILPDLVGLRRVAPSPVPLVRQLFPRVRRVELIEAAGVAPFDELCAPMNLAEAAAASVALPSIDTRTPDAVLARIAAVHGGRELGATMLTEALGASPRTIRRLATFVPDAHLVRAIRLQMGLRAATAAANAPAARSLEVH